MLQSKRWQIAQPVNEEGLARFPDLPPLIVQLLHNRGIDRPTTAYDFMTGHVATKNPFLMKGMEEAVGRLNRAINDKEPIAVYGDFDTDGVTATALLVEALGALGAVVTPYIPHRVDEGYGLNLDALRNLYRRQVRVVITVDCGIRSVEEVEQASKGLAMIITDHHSVGAQIPPAVAVINPKQPDCPYPFKMLAGVGVAYKLAQGLFGMRVGSTPSASEESLLDLVALGTVADLAPLEGENRSLVQRGLSALNKAERPGVEALMADAGLRLGQVDATAIGFRLGPRINAAGRLDSAMLAYDLLTSRKPLETKRLASKLGELNRKRQELTEKTVLAAEEQVMTSHPDAYLYMAAGEDFMSGIVGLAASRLTEAYYRPSIVVELGAEESRGSCRSIPEFNITEALDECQDLLIRYGGHAAAAGFTAHTSKLDELRHRLQGMAAEQLTDTDLRSTLEIDGEVPLHQLDWTTHKMLEQIEPCGIGNPQPVLVSRNVKVHDRRTIGSEQKHLKLTLRDQNGVAWDAIAFRKGNLLGEIPDRVDIAYRLEVNEWNHRRKLQLVIQDLCAPDA